MRAVILLLTSLATSPSPARLDVTSTAFDDNREIPGDVTCDGAGLSPPLAWSKVPAATKSIAILVDDPDAPKGAFTNWLVTNIPPTTTSLDEGVLPAGASVSLNDHGDPGFAPLCPLVGAHHFQFRVYALDTVLPDRLTRHDFIMAITDHILATGQLVGTYQRHGMN
jgi:Raf kinase inhibitor-like YbhB/YbcL family protein